MDTNLFLWVNSMLPMCFSTTIDTSLYFTFYKVTLQVTLPFRLGFRFLLFRQICLLVKIKGLLQLLCLLTAQISFFSCFNSCGPVSAYKTINHQIRSNPMHNLQIKTRKFYRAHWCLPFKVYKM